MKNYIRYGVHKKKTLLKDATKMYDGLVFPANILLYQYKATPGVVHYLDKPFLIDPMSFLFGEDFENFKKLVDGTSSFKPSFEKLLEGHGLDANVILKLNYKELRKEFLGNSTRLNGFVKSCIDFQESRVLNSLKGANEISESMVEIDEKKLRPNSVIPPYFFIDQSNFQESLKLNKQILDIAVASSNLPLSPLIYVNKVVLKDSARVDEILRVVAVQGVESFILWVEDFNEVHDANEEIIRGIASFVKKLTQDNRQLTFLHAGYFGMLFKFFGASAICHGLGYGEVRSGTASSKGGGPPPVRYYCKDLHAFLTLDRALEILRAHPDLLCDCPVCLRVTDGNPENITKFQGEDDLADLHYLYVRAQEKKDINSWDFGGAMSNLEVTITLYKDVEKVTRQVKDRKGNVYNEQILSPEYLSTWKKALEAVHGEKSANV